MLLSANAAAASSGHGQQTSPAWAPPSPCDARLANSTIPSNHRRGLTHPCLAGRHPPPPHILASLTASRLNLDWPLAHLASVPHCSSPSGHHCLLGRQCRRPRTSLGCIAGSRPRNLLDNALAAILITSSHTRVDSKGTWASSAVRLSHSITLCQVLWTYGMNAEPTSIARPAFGPLAMFADGAIASAIFAMLRIVEIRLSTVPRLFPQRPLEPACCSCSSSSVWYSY
jgi:hypothetical protein